MKILMKNKMSLLSVVVDVPLAARFAVLVALAVASGARAEVSGFDHSEKVKLSNCKPTVEAKPVRSPVGPICSYVQRLCDVSEGEKVILRGVHIDVDCAPSGERCPSIMDCAKSKLPDRMAAFVKTMNDPNSNSVQGDGAGIESRAGGKAGL